MQFNIRRLRERATTPTKVTPIAGQPRRRLGRLLASVALGAAAISAPASAQYELVWEDNFDGNAVDTSKWSFQTGNGCPGLCGWGNNEEQYYRSQNATVSNGTLKITARRENIGGAQYTSARMRTLNKGEWTYGRYEMRAKLPSGRGLWPAFWMLPTDSVYGVWAASGEMDIMECLGQNPERVYGTLHFGDTFPGNTQSGANYTLPSGTFSDEFHTFTMDWEPNQIRWYVDGNLYSTKTNWWSSGGSFPAPFNQRFHLLLNLAVGGNFPGPPNNSTPFPSTFEIDYVRVFQEVEPDPNACEQMFDNMEHGNPAGNGYFQFNSSIGGGGVSANYTDLSPSNIGATSLEAGYSGIGATGFVGGFGRLNPIDVTNATHYSMWINPDAGQDYTIEINLQDDDDGTDIVPGTPDGLDDEFQYNFRVSPTGPDAIAGGGWQKISIPISSFTDDNSYHFGGNGVFDPTPTSAGGNGQLVNIVYVVILNSGTTATFRMDDIAFVRNTSGLSGRVWSDENPDGSSIGEPGFPNVDVDLIDSASGIVLASTVTDANGDYAFTDLVDGLYEVRIDAGDLPFGVTPISDPDGIATPGVFTVDLLCDDVLIDQDFGYDPLYIGQNVCTPAVPNSSGFSGDLKATGSVVAADNDINLFASSLPQNQSGYFLASTTQGFLPNPGGSQGNLCVLGNIGRYRGPGQVLNAGALGLVSLQLDLTQTPQPTGNVSVQAGQTWYFQFWFRDASPGSTSNFTEAVCITFQ